MKRQRLSVSLGDQKRDILNEVLLHRSAACKAIPEFEFRIGSDEFGFPTTIVSDFA